MGAYLRKKRLTEKFSPTRFAAVVAATLSVFVLYKFVAGAAQYHQVAEEAAQLREQVVALQTRQETLQNQLAYVKSDVYVEHVARTQLKWTRTGETAVVVVPSSRQILPAVDAGAPSQPQEQTGVAGSIRAWWKTFFHTTPPVAFTPR